MEIVILTSNPKIGEPFLKVICENKEDERKLLDVINDYIRYGFDFKNIGNEYYIYSNGKVHRSVIEGIIKHLVE